jgi:hypothetical protein
MSRESSDDVSADVMITIVFLMRPSTQFITSSVCCFSPSFLPWLVSTFVSLSKRSQHFNCTKENLLKPSQDVSPGHQRSCTGISPFHHKGANI